MVSTHKKENHQKRQFSQLNGALNDFVIGSNFEESVMENDTLEPRTNSRFNNAARIFNGEDAAFRNQVSNKNFYNKIKKAVDNAVKTVKSRMNDAISTTMDKMVIPWVKMAVRSITGSTGHDPNSVVQNPDRNSQEIPKTLDSCRPLAK